ncbi:MAG TPA: glycosyltransferase [Acidimicrobiales bacterium]|nr:glycosyltransferase [Acidimicrobiales bacterium]
MHAVTPESVPVAVVVCTRDRPAMLEGALTALRQALRPGDEAVVVDSASTAPTTAAVARAAGFEVVRCDEPGASRARNAGARSTAAPIVAFTDDDCRVLPDWTSAIAAAFQDPAVGFVSGRVLPDRSEGPTVSAEGSQERRRFVGNQDPHDIGHGASMAFRRQALGAAGGFDERLGAGVRLRGAEDKDVFWRLLRRGWVGVYEPSVTVTHVQWRGRLQTARTNFGYGLGAGAFAAKVARLDGDIGRRMLIDRAWLHGVRAVGRAARRRHKQGMVDSLAWTAGVTIGAVPGALLPLEGDRFRS